MDDDDDDPVVGNQEDRVWQAVLESSVYLNLLSEQSDNGDASLTLQYHALYDESMKNTNQLALHKSTRDTYAPIFHFPSSAPENVVATSTEKHVNQMVTQWIKVQQQEKDLQEQQQQSREKVLQPHQIIIQQNPKTLARSAATLSTATAAAVDLRKSNHHNPKQQRTPFQYLNQDHYPARSTTKENNVEDQEMEEANQTRSSSKGFMTAGDRLAFVSTLL